MRLSFEGARTVVITDHRQLLGFMQRKNVQGRISQGRLLSFFKAMNLATLTEYAKECMLWGVTLGPHELVHLPFNAVVAESVSATTIGLRWACLPDRASRLSSLMPWTPRSSPRSHRAPLLHHFPQRFHLTSQLRRLS